MAEALRTVEILLKQGFSKFFAGLPLNKCNNFSLPPVSFLRKEAEIRRTG
jgi:hypothetical protein